MTRIFLCFALVCAAASALSPSDFEITALPGLNETLGFKQYSGYMPIQDGHGTEIFFWFVESQRAPSEDPVVLWMNVSGNLVAAMLCYVARGAPRAFCSCPHPLALSPSHPPPR